MDRITKILIIDDSEDDRLLYRRALQKSPEVNYSISETDNGDQGIERIVHDQPDCILLDYSMPGRNGLEVLKHIRSKHPFIPIVVLTGQGSENLAVAVIQEGAQNYLSKSAVTPETLDRVIRIAIEHCSLQKRLHEQRNSLEIFTHALAHDLKEPVRTIHSFIELIARDQNLSPKAADYFQYIQKSASRMASLIDAVHMYTRIDAATEQMPELCDLNEIVGEIRLNLNQLISEKHATIEVDNLPELRCNGTQLSQVFQNLISNAIRHCDVRPVIHISAEKKPGNYFLFRVRDNGTGISEEYRDKIFEPFKRMTRSSEQGLGLGLAICKKIIEKHGGKIWYESQPGVGTTFLFTLPVLQESLIVKEANRSPFGPSRASIDNADLANILLVEDNKADVELARIMLIDEPQMKCNFTVAHDGYEALQLLRESRNKSSSVDLMLLDINMPRMNGFELLEKMQSEEKLRDIPVIMCSTSNYDKDMQKAKALGAVGYIIKPAEINKLRAIIQHLSGVKLSQENKGFRLLRAV